MFFDSGVNFGVGDAVCAFDAEHDSITVSCEAVKSFELLFRYDQVSLPYRRIVMQEALKMRTL